MRKVGASAFKGCVGVGHVELPEGLQIIESDAFMRTGLRNLHVPATVNSIGQWKGVTSHSSPAEAFDCPLLERITVDARNRRFDSREDCNALILTRQNVLALGCSNTVVPNSVTAIGSEAFRGLRGLERIALPDSVMRIDNAAFAGCEHLQQVTLGKGLRTVGNGAFSRCARLRSIELPESLEQLGESSFSGCTSLERVWIGKGLLELYPRVFADCPNLREIIVDPNNRLVLQTF